jgi:ribosomal-protein-alanine N-acetyltransferase
MEVIENKNPFNKNLKTPRLLLRRVRESDEKDMFEYTSNCDITKFLSWYPHSEITQTKKYIAHLISEYDMKDRFAWAIEISEFNKFIGIVRIFDVSFANKRGELSYILNPAFQGKGIALEAIKVVIEFCFAKVGLNRIQAKCTPDNLPSEKVIQRLGMSYEGTLKEFWINKGNFADARLYALLAANYLKLTSENSLKKE